MSHGQEPEALRTVSRHNVPLVKSAERQFVSLNMRQNQGKPDTHSGRLRGVFGLDLVHFLFRLLSQE